MVQFGEAQLVLVTSTDPSRLQLMVKHTASNTLDVQFSTGVHGVPLRSRPHVPLNVTKVQPVGAVAAAAGDARLSMITGAVQAATPAAALALIIWRRFRPRRSVPSGTVTATSQPTACLEH